MGLIVKTLILLIRCRIHYWFNIESAYRASYESLISEHSYRLGDGYHKRITIGLSYLKNSIQVLFSSKDRTIKLSKGPVAVFDGAIKSSELRKTYLEGLIEKDPSFYCARDAISISGNTGHKLLATMAAFLLASWYTPHLLFSSKRASYALLLLEFSEWILMQIHLHQQSTRHLILFSSYEIDSNMICLLMRQNGIITQRIPSSNTLFPYYQNVVCDIFSYTSAFQIDERNGFSNWFVDETNELPPFNYKELLKTELGNNYDNSDTLGFISSGVWRRKQRGDLAAGIGEYESEELLIQSISKILKENRDLKLYIYFHPCEKETDEIYQEAKEIYSKEFASSRIEFCPKEISSLAMFYKSDIAVSVYSSTNIERLFLGMKTLYFPAMFKVKVFENTSLEKILIQSPEELSKQVNISLQESDAEFMSKRGLERYPNFGLKSN